MKYIYALFICLMALASPTLAETDPVSYEEFPAANDISFTASEILDEYRGFGCEESNDVRGYIPHADFDPVFKMWFNISAANCNKGRYKQG